MSYAGQIDRDQLAVNPMIGQTFAHYSILEKIGEGGMGIVYRAMDTKLDRSVALKFLHRSGSDDSTERARLLREARSAASLTHPNICTVYGLEEVDGQQCIVMEYIEGSTLFAASRNPTFTQKLAVAIQIAEGLTAAHEKGITHRDVKPDNIFVRKDGLVQIMDFGLAKWRQVQGLTVAGSQLGTFRYMSPEQIRGIEADTLSDLFSFGVVMYELFTDRHPFRGMHEAALMYEIVHAQVPPPSTVRPELPRALDEIVAGCLEKEPEDRFQSAAEVARLLRKVRKSGVTPPAKAPPLPDDTTTVEIPGKPDRLRRMLGGANVYRFVSLALLAGSVILGVLHFSETTPVSIVVRFQLKPVDTLSVQSAALSPDGTRLAFVSPGGGTTHLYMRELKHTEPYLVERTEGAAKPFWSHDSRHLGFFAGGTLKRVGIDGGAPIVLCEASNGHGGTWNQYGEILFAAKASGVIYRVPATGGIPEPVTSLDTTTHEIQHLWPFFLPDGKHFIYSSRNRERGESTLRFAALGVPFAKTILVADGNALYSRPGILLFAINRTVLAQKFDPDDGTISGDRYTIADNVGLNPADGMSTFSASTNGVLALYGGRSDRRQFLWVDRGGDTIGHLGPPGNYFGITLSPNNEHAATVIVDPKGGNSDVWTIDLKKELLTRFTFDAAADENPVWSPDGLWLTFTSFRSAGSATVYVKQASGTNDERTLPLSGSALDWAGEAEILLFAEQGSGDIWYAPTDGSSEGIPLIESAADEQFAQFSPGGTYVAYASNESGRFEVYVRLFREGGGTWQISTDGGSQPRWSQNGNELFYLAPDQTLMSVKLSTRSGLEWEAPVSLFKIPDSNNSGEYSYDVSNDAKRFLLNVPSDPNTRVPAMIVVNWLAEIKPLKEE